MSSYEHQAAQPHQQEKHEHQKSFDILASVNNFRRDIASFGQVLPETREQSRNEELSYLVEGAERASRTEFRLRREGGHLVYFRDGQWRPYQMMLETGLTVARNEAVADHRKSFLYQAAERDWEYGLKMQSLRPGDSVIWDSRYPYNVEAHYGPEFMREVGMNPDRKMGFMYRAYCLEDDSVVLETQTVDNSDDEAFDAALTVPRYDAAVDLDTLVRTYDGTLRKKYGKTYYAGREGESSHNAWQDIVVHHQDLAEYLLQGIETIAMQALFGEELEHAVKQHIYGVWAAFKSRLDRQSTQIIPTALTPGIAGRVMLEQEVRGALNTFAREGRQMIGCGGAVKVFDKQLGSPTALFAADPADVFSAIFGQKKSETYKFDKKMFCVVCQTPPTKQEQKLQSKKMCGPCGICKACDKKLSKKS